MTMNNQKPPRLPDALQQKVWENVQGALRRRRRARWVVRAGAATALYTLGVLSANLWLDRDKPATSTEAAESPGQPAPAVVAAATPADPAQQAAASARPDRPADVPITITGSDRPGWMRAKDYGDKFLRETDIAAATRQYRRYLNGAAENGESLAPTPDDTWLLHALKRARTEEHDNA